MGGAGGGWSPKETPSNLSVAQSTVLNHSAKSNIGLVFFFHSPANSRGKKHHTIYDDSLYQGSYRQ